MSKLLRPSISGKAKETFNELKELFNCDTDSDTIQLAFELVRIGLENKNLVNYLKGKNEGLTLVQIQRKYNINYNTLKKLDNDK